MAQFNSQNLWNNAYISKTVIDIKILTEFLRLRRRLWGVITFIQFSKNLSSPPKCYYSLAGAIPNKIRRPKNPEGYEGAVVPRGAGAGFTQPREARNEKSDF